MPSYKHIKTDFPHSQEKKRVVTNLLHLREKSRHMIPEKTASKTLLIATWNIREFKSGARLRESYYYIAEIISKFDLVAVQEVAEDLTALKELIEILGPSWTYIVTDSTQGVTGGMERIAFLYDTGKVRFMRIAGEIVLPEKELIENKYQFARSPFLVSFQAGWFKFMLTSVHIYYGAEKGEQYKRRVDEISTIAAILSKRAKKEGQDYILLGDFNITSTDDGTFKALETGGFHVPKQLRLPSDIAKTHNYDQIAFNVCHRSDMQLFDAEAANKAGCFDYYDVVFREEDFSCYKKYFAEDILKGKDEEALKSYYLSKYRTFQMSDHLPLWVELRVDFSDEYLLGILNEKKQPEKSAKTLSATLR